MRLLEPDAQVLLDNLDDLELILDKNLTGPLVVEVIVESENIPLP